MVRILKLAQMTATDLATLKRRAELDIDQVIPIAQKVIQAIAQTGNDGLIQYAQKFDYSGATPDNIKVTPEEFTQAQQLVAPDIKRAVDQAFRNIKEVHQRQLPEEMNLAEIDRGIFAGEKITPIPSVGLYVPRGKGAFPSMMLMLTIPAMVAGVKQIVVCTPPDKEGNVEPVSLYVAQMAGVTQVYKLGGIQALAAMALGTTVVPKVDKLTGPCSIYGAAAKRVLFGTVDVGLPAGPSESIILADETTNPQLAALDLLIEAEHGPDSAALLVTHSETVAEKASQFAQEYLKKLPEWRREFCQTGLDAYGGIILTSSVQESLDFINDYAPEHLEVLVDDPLRLVGEIKNAGEILLGKYTPSSAATYAIGVNAVLPTGGFARSYSAVSVYDFLKRSTVAYLTSEGFEGVKETSKTLAHYEEFPAHAMAIEERDRLI
ncbi:MAG: histidinol dehydrogenase [Crocosphaera sp.]